ncbi:MAG: flagellar protein FlgN [Candidatus Goldbacteria bacterium]|nr:flagellar protein FlgN [Candidatus Goldiibacteriota bacterium]
MKKQTKEKFLNIIIEQKKLYSSLKELISTEYKALADKDIKSIDDIIKRQNEIISSIKKLEDEKGLVFDLMISEVGLQKTNTIKLGDVLARIDIKDAREIEDAIKELINIVKETELINQKNTGLLKNYIEYVDFVRNIKNKIENPTQITYTKDGQKKTETIRNDSKFDTKI